MQKHLIRCGLVTLSLLLGLAGSAGAQSTRNLEQQIDRLINQARFRNATWGIIVVDMDRGRTLYEHNASKSLVPASNVKLYTTAAALEQLGPGYRYRTELYADGQITSGVLRGRLIVRGAGDPTIGGRPDTLNPDRIFREWADSLRAAGITRIEGDIIGDDNYFDDVALGIGWSWDDEPYWYGAEIGALTYSENTVDFDIVGTRNGQRARVSWEPANTDYVGVINRTVTSGTSIREGYARERGSNEILLYSRVPAGRTDKESLSISNPTRFFVHTMKQSLERSGIKVDGAPRDVDDVEEKPQYGGATLRRIATHVSPPLREIVNVTNKESHNLYAEMLLKSLGAERRPEWSSAEPGSAEAGIDAAMATYRRAELDSARLRFIDGSGLSRTNLVTAASTARLLHYVWEHPNRLVRQAYYDSLPVGGRDGSLDTRFRTGPASGNVRAKTGTFRGASSLSGYVHTASERPLAFAIMCNNYTTSTASVREVQDAIVNLLARSSF